MIAEGWISVEEMELVAKFMPNQQGDILEVGAANGRLFSFLYPMRPMWSYTAVDPWQVEHVRLQLDWTTGYFDEGNLGNEITSSMFMANCPFANAHECYFEDFKTNSRFDVISLGLVGKNVDWFMVYEKANSMLKDDGVIVGRNYNHLKYGEVIKNVVLNSRIIDRCKGSFVIGQTHD